MVRASLCSITFTNSKVSPMLKAATAPGTTRHPAQQGRWLTRRAEAATIKIPQHKVPSMMCLLVKYLRKDPRVAKASIMAIPRGSKLPVTQSNKLSLDELQNQMCS